MSFTYDTFVARVKELMPKDGVRLGVSTTVSRLIDQAMIDIQSKVAKYRRGNETVYESADLVNDGNASRARIPDGALVDAMWLVQVAISNSTEECIRMPLDFYPWANRANLTCATQCLNGQRGFVAMDPQRVNAIVYPKIASPNRLLMVWSGIKTDYLPGEAVPFDDRCALACSDYVHARIARNGNQDHRLHDSYMASYATNLRSLFVDALK